MAIGATSGRAGAGATKDAAYQGVGRGANHGLEVETVVRQWGTGQGPLSTGPGGEPGAGEPGTWVEGERKRRNTAVKT